MTADLEQSFSVEITSHESITVQLRVIDALGATRQEPDLYTIDVSNRAPSIALQVTGYHEVPSGPFVLYRKVTLIAIPVDSDAALVDPDGDEVSLQWQLLPPTGSDPEEASFEPFEDRGYVLNPDVSGEWSVILTADDGHGGTDEIRRDFSVASDGPPCLQGMDPLPVDDAYYVVDAADGGRHFSVLSVGDALDAFPAAVDNDPVLGQATFRWLMRAPGAGAFVEIPSHTVSSYFVDPGVYSPGDQLALRVEVGDRVQGPERDLPCGDELWSCALDTGSQCFQRRTWGVEVR